ncbi:hypothetical protein GPECTOR_36g124 [Gonium pectorale]|uniref:C2 domain-containing protein n=1 Tax=Gonium pectorale TaxID=33097 RepID=A0A150GBR1_GONPE|nr:hypothetical protein GPECTOR_36g124 [Gonium pectorale]|eukprot:KXZ47272.1 hypothetical protein GPECTOR_36g124 [Gonium pectorale]
MLGAGAVDAGATGSAGVGRGKGRVGTPLRDAIDACQAEWFEEEVQEARGGNPVSMALVGQMLIQGYGCPRDLQAGKDWVAKALATAEAGSWVYGPASSPPAPPPATGAEQAAASEAPPSAVPSSIASPVGLRAWLHAGSHSLQGLQALGQQQQQQQQPHHPPRADEHPPAARIGGGSGDGSAEALPAAPPLAVKGSLTPRVPAAEPPGPPTSAAVAAPATSALEGPRIHERPPLAAEGATEHELLHRQGAGRGIEGIAAGVAGPQVEPAHPSPQAAEAPAAPPPSGETSIDLPGGVRLRDVHVSVGTVQVLPSSSGAGGAPGGAAQPAKPGLVEAARTRAAAGVAGAAGAASGLLAALESVLVAGEQRELLELAPAWAAAPDFEKTAAVNQLLQLLWPQLAAAAEAELRRQLREVVVPHVAGGGVPGLAALSVRRLTLGPAAPPRIGGVKLAGGWAGGGGGGGGEELVIELDVAWAAGIEVDLEARLGLAGSDPSRPPRLALPLLPPLRASLSRLALRGVVRLAAGPLLAEPPYVAAASLTLLQPPLLGGSLRLGLGGGGGGAAASATASANEAEAKLPEGAAGGVAGGGPAGGGWWGVDLMALPGVSWLVRSSLQSLLQRALVFPRHLLVTLVEGGGLPLPPPVLLRLRLLRAEGLRGPSATAEPDVYVTAQARGGPGRGGAGRGGAGSPELGRFFRQTRVREGAVQRSPTRVESSCPNWQAAVPLPGQGQAQGQGHQPGAAAGDVGWGGGGGHVFNLPVASPRRQVLLLRVMLDRKGWDDPPLAFATLPLPLLLPALREAEAARQGACGPAPSPTWVPLVVHLSPDAGGVGGGGALGAAARVPVHGLRSLGRVAAKGADGLSKLGRRIGRALRGGEERRTEHRGQEGQEGREEEGEEEEGERGTNGTAGSAAAAGGEPLVVGGGGGVGGQEAVLHLGAALRARPGSRADAGRLYLEASFLQLRPHADIPPAASAAATAATTPPAADVPPAAVSTEPKAVPDMEQERQQLSGPAAAASAVVEGLTDPRVVAAGAAGAAAGGAAGTGGAAGDGGAEGKEAGEGAKAPKGDFAGGPGGGGGGGPVRVEVGAMWPGGPSRAVHRAVRADEQALLAVRVLRLRQLVASSNAGAAAGVDPFVELLLLDAAGRVTGVARTPPRYNAPDASWEELELELLPAAAGGALVARAWDKTTALEAVGSLALGDTRGLEDQLLGQVRIPLAALAGAGRLRRSWLLSPAGSRTTVGAPELEMLLSWTPLPI